MGCDVRAFQDRCGFHQFQSTHPSGVRPYRDGLTTLQLIISIHAPQWGATWCGIHARSSITDSNPRTPVGCDRRLRGVATHTSISIHAPQWGATQHATINALRLAISIHAPQWGATVTATLFGVSGKFQSTHPSGVRLADGRKRCNRQDFNPRTPVGCDDGTPIRTPRSQFQSTHPSGVRPCRLVGLGRCIYFNPRTPVGCDRGRSIGIRRCGHISIHAPQWGATDFPGRSQFPYGFQSTHPSGVRPPVGHKCAQQIYFNPRTPVGCDLP